MAARVTKESLRNTEKLVSVGLFQGRQEKYPKAISRPLGCDLRDIVHMRGPFSGPARDTMVGPYPEFLIFPWEKAPAWSVQVGDHDAIFR